MVFLRRFKRLPSRLKTTYSILILVIFIGIGTFVWAILSGKITPFAVGESASFYLTYETKVQVGTTFNVDINVNTELGASKISVNTLHYDPSRLELADSSSSDGIQIIEQSVSGMTVTQNNANAINGTITYVLETTGTPYQGQARIASARFRAIAEGEAQFSFDFDAGNPIYTGDCDVIPNIDGIDTDILRYASSSSMTILGESEPTSEPTSTSDPGGESGETHNVCVEAKKVCVSVTGAGENQCLSNEDCLRTPEPEQTPEIIPEPTSNPEEVNNETNEIAQVDNPTSTPTPIVTPTILTSVLPTPVQIIPEESTPPAVIKIAGIGISKTMSIILFIGLPLLITLITYLVWYYKKKKKDGFVSSSNKEDDDDDEII